MHYFEVINARNIIPRSINTKEHGECGIMTVVTKSRIVTANRNAMADSRKKIVLTASLVVNLEPSFASATSAVEELELLPCTTPNRTFFGVSLELRPELRNGSAIRLYTQRIR